MGVLGMTGKEETSPHGEEGGLETKPSAEKLAEI
jgi:hypothetical protein